MSPRTIFIAAALTAGAMTTLPAAAAERQEQASSLPLQILFNLVDTNGDGFIDVVEITTLQQAIFVAIDGNGDGKLSKAELVTATATMRRGQMMMMMRQGEQGPGFQRGDRGGPGPMRGQRGGEGHGPDVERGGPRGDRQGQMQPHDFDRGPLGPGLGFGPGGRMGGTMPVPPFGEAETGAPMGLFGGGVRDFASLDADGDGAISIEEFAAAGPRLPGAAE